MPETSGKILVVRGGAVGDFILTIPVLTALRAQFPSIPLELLGYARVAELALAAGLVQNVRSIDARPMASFFAKGGQLPPAWAEYFGRFDVIVSYLFDPDLIFQENVRRCTTAQFLAGPHRPDETGDLHATNAFLRPLARLAIFDADPVPKLRLPGTATLSPPAPRNEWLAVHPGSGSERKNWPEDKWHSLLQALASETNRRFLLVGGEAEGERIQRLISAVPGDRVRVAQNLPLPKLGLLLQQCASFLGHDSGISHLAAAVGLRGLLLWGHTNARIWRPRSDQFTTVSDPRGLDHLEVREVLSAFRQHFPESLNAVQQFQP